MHEVAPLIYDLAVMLGVASIVTVLFQKIRQPVVLGYLIAGVILGPHTYPYTLVSDVANIRILSELGVIFLLFSLGLEFSFQKLLNVGFSASVTGFLEVILMVFIGYLTGIALGWSYYDSLFLGAALSISSTTIIIKAIDELRLKTKRFAELVFGILIVEDLLAILLLVALTTLVMTRYLLTIDMGFATIKLILVVGGWFLIGYFLVPPLFRRISAYISEETLTIISVALCLMLVCVAAYFNYSTALGAFIMGSILAETVLNHRIQDLIKPIRDIFAAVFFISVGMLIDPGVIVEQWYIVIIISLVTIIGKLVTTSMGAFLSGQSLNTSVRVGFSMAQVGEFSFIIVGLGLTLGVISDKIYPDIVAVSGITAFTTPYLIRLSGHIGAALEKNLSLRTKYLLNTYSAWVYRALSTSQSNSIFSPLASRLLINGILVAIIFSMVHYLAFIRFGIFPKEYWLNNILFLLISLVISSPFIWGMLYSYKHKKIPKYTKRLNPVIFVIWFITFSEVVILSLVYFRTWVTLLIVIASAIMFFATSYRHLEKSYRWFEERFISNITPKESSQKYRYEELAPWDTHLVEIEVGSKSPLIGKTLAECHIRERYGVNIVAISHGSRIIAAPRGNEHIIAHDKLIVLGVDKLIDAFEQHVQAVSEEAHKPISFLSNFTLKAFLLDNNNPLVGKTIRTSKIREHLNGLVVGIERKNLRLLNPDPGTIFRAGDLILIVGEVKKIENLNWQVFKE